MTAPSSPQAGTSLPEACKDKQKQTDKDARLALALRRNLLRRKQAGKAPAESDGQ